MSVIQGKPFIEKVIDVLTEEEKTTLLGLVNGTDKTPTFKSLINQTDVITEEDKGVSYVVLETYNKTFTGYLIYKGIYCVFVAFTKANQDLQILKINLTNSNYEVVREHLNILELRVCLSDASEHITTGDIDSGDAPKGQVLTADGESGASWENRVELVTLVGESGNLTDAQIEALKQDNAVVELGDNGQHYYKNSQNNYYIVFKAPARVVSDDTIAEKVVVDLSDNTFAYSYDVVATGGSVTIEFDSELNDSSTNGVQNKVIYEALEEKADTEDLINGQIVVGKSLTTKQVDNVSEESGSTQTDPFLLQGTGTNNNTTETPTSPVAKQLELRGNSVVVNQIFDFLSVATTTNNGITFTNNNDGSFTLNGTATATAILELITSDSSPIFPVGHKILVLGQTNESNCYIQGYSLTTGIFLNYEQSIFTMPNTGTSYNFLRFRVESGTTLTNKKITPKVIDLTKWFNDDIAQDLLDNPEKFVNYYQGDLSYNEGELVDCNATELDTIEFNQCNENWHIDPQYNTVLKADEIRVLPNSKYFGKFFDLPTITACYFGEYDKDGNLISGHSANNANKEILFETSSNAWVVIPQVNLTSQATLPVSFKTNFNLSWDGQRDGEYQPFVKHTYALGNDVLKSAGGVYDSKAPDGTITRYVGVVDLGSLEWTYSSAQTRFYVSFSAKGSGDNTKASNLICPIYNNIAYSSLIGGNDNMVVSISSDGSVLTIRNTLYTDADTFKQAIDGVMLYYELAEPTTEQGTAFAENIVVDDYGTMEFVNTNGVPQGNKFFYPADYVLLLDDLNNYLDEYDKSVNDLAFKSEISDSALAERGYLKLASLSGYDDTKTQVLKNIEGVFTWVDEE